MADCRWLSAAYHSRLKSDWAVGWVSLSYVVKPIPRTTVRGETHPTTHYRRGYYLEAAGYSTMHYNGKPCTHKLSLMVPA